ncbi:WhiB family transcriptional regulator [Gordonia sp. ABKF26]
MVLHDVAAINRAVALCERCPVFTACREGALRRGERDSTAPRSVIWCPWP